MKKFSSVVILMLWALAGSGAFAFSCHFSEENNPAHSSGPVSYVLELESTTQGSLVYFGTFHTINLNHPQFSRLERHWNRFEPDIALSEGCIWPIEESRNQSIRKYGEQGLLMYLAKRDNIPVACIDPSLRKQALYLSSRFDASQIKIYFILQQAIINRRMSWMNSTDTVNVNLHKWSMIPYFEVKPLDYEDFQFMFSRIFPEIEDWREFPALYFYDQKLGGFVADIYHELIEYRNKHMLKRLLKEVRKGKRVFAVVGRSHVVLQEPALRTALYLQENQL